MGGRNYFIDLPINDISTNMLFLFNRDTSIITDRKKLKEAEFERNPE